MQKIVELGLEKPDNEDIWPQYEKDILEKTRKKNQQVSLSSLIHQYLGDTMFEKAANTTTSEETWEVLQNYL